MLGDRLLLLVVVAHEIESHAFIHAFIKGKVLTTMAEKLSRLDVIAFHFWQRLIFSNDTLALVVSVIIYIPLNFKRSPGWMVETFGASSGLGDLST